MKGLGENGCYLFFLFSYLFLAVVAYYNPIKKGLLHNFKNKVLLRDHRKILVVDWMVGFTGGVSITWSVGLNM